ncbi:MAG: Asp23/Gls24 family envelope stress response protein [Erysipelotrichaceae bacterium]|nr:Asp23/Gls24 family envelope stress response protein [Erysipelotrichaceae bacterium]MBR5048419.1 Asp23/Gls24 family envelope stress response protein [Erysipelotrichaceae bacterium]
MEYIAAKKREDNNIGIIALSKGVFEGIARHSLDDDRQIKPYRPMSKNSVRCKVVDGRILLDVDVRIKNGCNVSETAARAQNIIKTAIAQMTGYYNTNVNVVVKGFFK